jgi:prephenate dehydratase
LKCKTYITPPKAGFFYLFQMIEEKLNIIKTVAIQGVHGAFHEIAAQSFFDENIEVKACDTFDDVINRILKNEVEFGVMAIENTVAGSLMPNYGLLRENSVKIIGEQYIRIKQNLMVLPGQTINDIREVHSHYMAIAQCRKFFDKHPEITLVESVDTALSAKKIHDEKLKGTGAIAGDLAAQLYGLEIIAPGIETNKRNYTRFLILTHQDNQNELPKLLNKASLCFSLPHKKGSLSKVLSIFTFYDLDLTKIQSMPIVGLEFQYFFYVDLTFEDFELYRQSLQAIAPLTRDMQVLGEYTYGIESFENVHSSQSIIL